MNTLQLCLELGELPKGRFDKTPQEFIAKRLAESPTGTIRLMESVCERENMRKALRRVEKNGGAPGVDGMRTSQLRGYLKRHWEKIKTALLDGTYKPFPVLRKEIKKPDGGVRHLGIPTVLDRCIQQAMAQVLQEIWEHTFSEYSYGFRPERSQHMAIKQAKCYVEEGYTHVVDIDLAKFFDRVNHDRLMSRLAQRIEDKRVLKIIRAFLNSGVLIGDVLEEPGEGTPQGGPLSPLLANIVLDERDKELDPPSSVDYGVSKQSVADLPRRSPQGEVG
jgi:RNA-directed DNA polymerase